MTSGIAKFKLIAKKMRPYTALGRPVAGMTLSRLVATTPMTPAKAMYGALCMPKMGTVSESTPKRLLSCHGMSPKPMSWPYVLLSIPTLSSM